MPIDCWVEAPIPDRQEGDTRIITLHAEVVVTETRLKAIEEVRITRRRDTRETIERVTVRREEAVVERIPARPPQVPQEELSGRCRPLRSNQPASMELEFMTTTIISTVDNAQVGKTLIAELVKAGLNGRTSRFSRATTRRSCPRSSVVASTRSRRAATSSSLEGEQVLVAARATDEQIEELLAIMERYEVSATGGRRRRHGR